MFLETIYISKILYFFTLLVLSSGFFIMLTSDNYVRKIIGLSVMQNSVLIFYLMLGKVNRGIVPIDFLHNSTSARSLVDHTLLHDSYNYSSPIPQVLMLTAIVVGFATLSLGISLIYRISKQFNTISEHKINFDENE